MRHAPSPALGLARMSWWWLGYAALTFAGIAIVLFFVQR
jgi:hypothetical protein